MTLRPEPAGAQEALYGSDSFLGIIGSSPPIVEVIDLIRKVAPTTVPVVVRGESGTGKELVARAIHGLSLRKDQRFVAVNCAALPDTLLEAELFGVRKGAFTGANLNRQGLFSVASGGTLFLDEVGTMSPVFQSKLLRAIQEKEITPLGDHRPIKVDVRILAASNADLEHAVERRFFREDLYYRLNVVDIALPPLRERMQDVPGLVKHFIRKYATEWRLESQGISPEAMDLLVTYRWPGNVRELENVIQRAIVLAGGKPITREHIVFKDGRFTATRPAVPGTGAEVPYEAAKTLVIEAFQREYLTQLMASTNGNLSRAARRAGITRAALRRIIDKLAIDRQAFEALKGTTAN